MKPIYVCIAVLLSTLCATALAGEFVLESVAGTGESENNGDTGPADRINIGEPFGVEVGPDGAVYVTEVRNHRVRRLDLDSGVLSTVAGNGRAGYSGDGGPATEAELNEPYEVRFDSDGNMLFVEMRNHLIRRVDGKSKRISTVAGTGRQGFGGDGGTADRALFNEPHSIALDGNGAIYVADIGNHRIRRIDPETRIVETIAGNSQKTRPHDGQVARGNPIPGPRALYIDGNTLWIALREGHSIWRMDLTDGILRHVAGTGEPGFAGDGGPALLGKFNGPKGIALDADKRVFVADTENNAIRMIDPRTGIISTVAGGPSQPAGKTPAATTPAPFNRPHGICVGRGGEIFVGDTLNHQVHRLRRSVRETPTN